MYDTQEAVSPWSWVYFIFLIMFGSFFIVNLALAVLYLQFTKEPAPQQPGLSTAASGTNGLDKSAHGGEASKGVEGGASQGAGVMSRVTWEVGGSDDEGDDYDDDGDPSDEVTNGIGHERTPWSRGVTGMTEPFGPVTPAASRGGDGSSGGGGGASCGIGSGVNAVGGSSGDCVGSSTSGSCSRGGGGDESSGGGGRNSSSGAPAEGRVYARRTLGAHKGEKPKASGRVLSGGSCDRRRPPAGACLVLYVLCVHVLHMPCVHSSPK